MSTYFFLFIFIFLSSCQSNSNEKVVQWHKISSPTSQAFLYRAQIPSYWIHVPSFSYQNLNDKVQPVCELLIIKNKEQLHLTVHLFPYDSFSARFSPQAQIARWKRQFNFLHAAKTVVRPCSHGGFHGLYLETEGEQEGQTVALMGWSLQLAAVYDAQLVNEENYLKRADYTIKASGPLNLMQQYRKEIIAFAESFELIDELPSLL